MNNSATVSTTASTTATAPSSDYLSEYRQAANEGKLLLKRCIDSGRAFHPPRNFSPFTGSTQVEWITASGQGTLYSYSIIQPKDKPAHCIAYVELAEGPIMMTNLVDYDPTTIVIGQAVELTFIDDAQGQAIAMFKPA
ncbi:MAG: Zn-ribbon domain-containing OB-fold protein [Oceanobacter sp.]